MLFTGSSPEFRDTNWPEITDLTGVDVQAFKSYLGKSEDSEFAVLYPGKMNEEGDVILKAGNGIWEATYFLKLNEKTLYIVDINAHGYGVGIFTRLVEFGTITSLYNQIELNAGKIGTYVWPRYGFMPPQDEWDSLRTADNRLQLNMEEIRRSSSDPALVALVSTKLDSLLQSSDPKKIWEIADQKDEIQISRGRVGASGQLLLQGDAARYFATFNLLDISQLQRFEDYKRKYSQI